MNMNNRLKVHAATAQPEDEAHCQVCGQRIARVTGQGRGYIHTDSGAVAAPNPPNGDYLTPIMVTAEVIPGKVDRSATARFANYSRAETYAASLLKDYASVVVTEDDDSDRGWHLVGRLTRQDVE